MVEMADIFRIHGQAYLEKYGTKILPSHKKAMWAIKNCRTDTFGGHVYLCKKCEDYHYSFHSCKNRHCPKCSNENANQWLEQQNNLILPIIYFMVTFTLPEVFRKIARSNQKKIYNIFFRTSAAALQKLAWDEKFVGGLLGMVAVLQTWTRDMLYHPHIHFIVTGGGLSADGNLWINSSEKFLVRVQLLSTIFRAKFRDELKKIDLYQQVPAKAWKQNWNVNCIPVGSGNHALKYLAPYIFRVAISNNRILKLENGKVTFCYKKSNSQKLDDKKSQISKICTLPAEKFISRFLQHVLPDRFIKVRYYGLLSSRNRCLLNNAKKLLVVKITDKEHNKNTKATDEAKPKSMHCPKCGEIMILIKEIKPKERPYFGKNVYNDLSLIRAP